MAWWSFGERPRDDRGVAVDVARADLALELEVASVEKEPELEEIWRRSAGLPQVHLLMQRLDAVAIVRVLAMGAAVLLFMAVATILALPQSVARYAWPVPMFGVLLVLAPFGRTRHFGRWIELYTYYGRCAQCLSSLRGIAPAEDGCVVCPECAAAWRASRIAPASVLDGLRATDAQPTPEKPTPDHRDGRGWMWPPKPVRDTVHDAYARPVLLAPANLSNLSAEERAAIPPEVLAELRHIAANWMDRVATVVLLLGAIALCLWFAYSHLRQALPLRLTVDSAMSAVGVAGATAFAGFCAVRITRYFRPTKVTNVSGFLRAMLRADRCPSCAGSLERVQRGERGVRRCPRCGAEWAPAGRVVAKDSGACSRAR